MEDPVAGGAIDSPAAGSVAGRGPVRITGWAATAAGPCSRIELTLDNRPLGRAGLGRYRPDVAEATGQPAAIVSGFELLADLSVAGCAGPGVTLGGWGVGVDGHVVELPPVALTLVDCTRDHGAPAPRRPRVRAGSGPLRVLVCSHDLRYGGAQLTLAEMFGMMRARHQITGEVLSFGEGPVFEQSDLDVRIWPRVNVDSAALYESTIADLCEWVASRRYDVALVSTIVAFPAADACLRLGIPVAWAIHESYRLPLVAPTFRIGDGVAPRLEQALADAGTLVFSCEATRRCYEAYLPATPCATLPHGVDVDALDRWRAGFDRTQGRETVILCLGTITPRKGQVALIQAFATIADRHPDVVLQLVGPFAGTRPQALSAAIAAYGLGSRVRIGPGVSDVRPWYASADLLVSASDVESTPRSMLEAMALRLPVLGTAVFGVPELITDGQTGWLCEPNDVAALAGGLDRVLSLDPAERARVARNAHRKVHDEYRSDVRAHAWSELLHALARG